MATKLLGAVNSVSVNSTYPVNGSVYVTNVLPGFGTGDQICIPFEGRNSSVRATEVVTVPAEVVTSAVMPETNGSGIGSETIITIQAEDRNSVVQYESRNSDINERDTC